MSSFSVPSLALLVLQGTATDADLAPLDRAPSTEPPHGSAYAELAVARDGSPYAELEVPRVPWSHGVTYRGWDAIDLLAELTQTNPPRPDQTR